jgi:hypothetical protein
VRRNPSKLNNAGVLNGLTLLLLLKVLNISMDVAVRQRIVLLEIEEIESCDP